MQLVRCGGLYVQTTACGLLKQTRGDGLFEHGAHAKGVDWGGPLRFVDHWLALARDESHVLRDAALGLEAPRPVVLAAAGVHFEMWFVLKGLHRNER